MRSIGATDLSALDNFGPADRVFSSLLLVGPLVIVLISVLGRSLLTETVAMGYVALLVGYVLYLGVERGTD